MYLFFDTETTGVEPTAAIVQFAAILYDEKRNHIGQFKTMVKPDGWTIPAGASAIHGIYDADCERYGLPILEVLRVFNNWCKVSDKLIAHNITFDIGKVQHQAKLAGVLEKLGMPTNQFCTMKATTDICKLPGRYGSYKWPKLIEAHQHLFGEGFDGAHDALADVKACARIYFHLLDLKNPAPAQVTDDNQEAAVA